MKLSVTLIFMLAVLPRLAMAEDSAQEFCYFKNERYGIGTQLCTVPDATQICSAPSEGNKTAYWGRLISYPGCQVVAKPPPTPPKPKQ